MRKTWPRRNDNKDWEVRRKLTAQVLGKEQLYDVQGDKPQSTRCQSIWAAEGKWSSECQGGQDWEREDSLRRGHPSWAALEAVDPALREKPVPTWNSWSETLGLGPGTYSLSQSLSAWMWVQSTLGTLITTLLKLPGLSRAMKSARL